MTEPETRRQKWLLCGLLGAAALAVFSRALHCGFVNYDDPAYVTENWHVQHGLNWQSIQWAFTTDHAANWHPMTWVSHILDCQFYGLAPAGHHLTSLLLHAANAVLLFLLLRHMTGALWRSAFVVAMFALHPLRVESVVWVAERKDVLSALFWMLSVGAYVRYADKLKIQGPNNKFFYALSLFFFILGLMSKPMVVTLPFVLLLLDYWPLGRWKFWRGFSWRLVVEKVPFFVLAAGSSLVTFLVQNSSGAVASLTRFPIGVRLANIPVAYARYLMKNFWPADFAAYYPYVPWQAGEIIGAVALLAAITWLALWRVRTAPFLAVGWFWFLGMLVPAIGFLQTGGQSLADRYTYLPCIGLWIMVGWGLDDLGRDRPRLRGAMTTAAALAVVFFALTAWHRADVYKDSETLWKTTLRSCPNNPAAHNNLAKWLMNEGRWNEAAAHCRETLALWPRDPNAHDILSLVCLHQGRLDDALAEALLSIQYQSRSEENRQTIARVYLEKGDFAAASAALRQGIQIDPSVPEAWCNLGYALLRQGQVSEAIPAYQRSLELNPDYALAHNDLGDILLHQGRLDQAMDHFQRAVQLAPSFAEAHYNLAGVLAQRGRLDEAIAHCQKALEIQPGLAPARQRLADLNAARERNRGR